MTASKIGHFWDSLYRPLRRCVNTALDVAVKAAATRYAMGTTMALLLAWSIWGAVQGASNTWQVVLQDVSSIQAYLSDTLLLRQQAMMTRNLCARVFGLMARSEASERMLLSMTPAQREAVRRAKRHERDDVAAFLAQREDLLDKVSNAVAAAAGSLIFLLIYTAGIIVWVFMGIPHHWSNLWQLIINTSTAFEITFMSMFLQNIRGQHEDHLERVVRGIDTMDDAMDGHLQRLTGAPAAAPIAVPSLLPPPSRWHRIIDKYGRIIGGGAGVLLAVVVFIVWLAVGEPMHFDDNWFLIIGTYTGLAGFIDGFVLKNVDRRQTALGDRHFARLLEQDRKVFDLLGLPMPQTPEQTRMSLTLRISIAVGNWCASTVATYAAVGVVVILIAIASAMHWTETGQLLCNSPTMIVEGFLLVTLLQAHNLADSERRIKYDDVLKRRLVLEGHLAALDGYFQPRTTDEDEKGIQKPPPVVISDSAAC